jgi:tetratricopeptide (TPR) repeat protein
VKRASKNSLVDDTTFKRLRDRCVAVLKKGAGPEAEAACRSLLDRYPNNAEAHAILGDCLAQSPRPQQAFPFYEQALKLDPDNLFFALSMGRLHKDFELYELALPLLRRATPNHPAYADFQNAIGEIYLAIGTAEQAIAPLNAALVHAKNKVLSQTISSNLVSALASVGEREKALELAEGLIDQLPLYLRVKVLQEMVNLQTIGFASDLGRKLESLVNDAFLPVDARIVTLLLVGRLHERDGEADLAFKAWSQARELSKSQRHLVQPRVEHLKQFKAFYTPELFDAVKNYGHESDVPVFVLGMPRSGTTLTEQILAAHPDCVGVGELLRWVKLETAFQRDHPSNSRLDRMRATASQGELKARASESLSYLRFVAGKPCKRIIEKTPHNFQAAGFHHLCFPNARFVHVRRNPMDCFISAYQQNMAPTHGYAYDQTTYFEEWLFHDQLMGHWKSIFPDKIFTLHYEDLVNDPEGWSRKLVAFVGLPWNDRCLKYFDSQQTIRTYSNMQARQPIFSTSVERWRRYEQYLGPLQRAMVKAGFVYQTT